MLITQALNGVKALKGQTLKRRIKHIATSKNHLNINYRNNSMDKQCSADKQNQNPNIKKSPAQEDERINQGVSKGKQIRIKSSNTSLTKQTPMRKISFIKNLCYKSNNTSKNQSVDKKEQLIHKLLSLGNFDQRNVIKMQNKQELKSQRQNLQSKCHPSDIFIYNQSEISEQGKTIERDLKQLKKDTILHQNQSPTNYRLSITPSQVHPRLYPLNESSSIKHNFQRVNSFESKPTHGNQAFVSKYSRMCPNIQNPGFAEMEAFKNKNYLFPAKNQAKPLISLDRQKKQTLSSKKNNSRPKRTSKPSQNDCLSIQSESKNQQAEIKQETQKWKYTSHQQNKANNCPNNQIIGIHELLEGTDKKMQESTLIQTRSKDFFQETLGSLDNQFGQLNLNESKQSNSMYSNEKQTNYVYCNIHPQKQAKFKINKEGNRPFYCSKCTVLLVTQGYRVVYKLQQNSSRMQTLKKFISKIQALRPQLKRSDEGLIDLQSQAYQLNKKGQQQIVNYYQKLNKALQEHKENALNGLQYHFQSLLAWIQTLRKSLAVSQGQIKFMKSDVLSNIDQIVNQQRLPESSFKQIIFEHQNKLSSLEQLAKQIGGEQNKVIFKTVHVPASQIKLAINALEKTQIVFVDKALNPSTKIHTDHKQDNQSKSHPEQVTRLIQNRDTDQMKRSFSFDEQNLDASFYLPSSKRKMGNFNLPTFNDFFQLGDSVRLSFDNQLQTDHWQTLKSPNFKAI